MNEGRIVLSAFGVAAIVMIALPVATIFTKTPPVASDAARDGEVSRFFLKADIAASPPQRTRILPGIDKIFPKGLPQATVFEKVAASGFTCATDANAATCYRTAGSDAPGCTSDWSVRLIFTPGGTVWSSTAQRATTCS